ncbi:MAG: NAD(P)H-dependent oxidoreductase, partial [Lachnospiraceae bacterium]|nr:NAD(P)H-dependent oxidoreductase [Lachnospiraceae bacterium]
MSILFINASPNKAGNTARLARELLSGREYETLNLADYKIYAYGQNYADDQFQEVIDRIKEADTVVMGSPLYWHNICGLLRNFLDRCYGPVRQGAFSGKELYF